MSLKVMVVGTGSFITIVLFGFMCHLMMSVNPPPLPTEKPLPPTPPKVHRRIQLPPGANIIFPSGSISDPKQAYYSVTEDFSNLVLYTVQRVVPPVWPRSSEITSEQPELTLKDNMSEGKEYVAKLENDDMGLIGKRSVADAENERSELDSIVLKVIDDSGQFNIEIRIGTNDASTKEKIDTREIQSKDITKYSMSLKTKNNDKFKINELAKKTIIHVQPNNSVFIVEYDDELKSKKTENGNLIEASIVDLINENSSDKSAAMPVNKDILPIVFSSNKTKLSNHTDTNGKGIDKMNLTQKLNHTYLTNLNKLHTVNDTYYNLTAKVDNTTLQTFVTTRNENTTKSVLIK